MMVRAYARGDSLHRLPLAPWAPQRPLRTRWMMAWPPHGAEASRPLRGISNVIAGRGEGLGCLGGGPTPSAAWAPAPSRLNEVGGGYGSAGHDLVEE